jgi:hypothetical protein
MLNIESLITKFVWEIGKVSVQKGWKVLSRKDKILRIVKSIGFTPGKPEPVFESVYVHSLVEYGIEKPELVLDFFRHEDIQKAFQDSFIKKDPSVLYNEAARFMDWNKIGDELRKADIDLRDEFAAFTLVFNEMVNLTRTPAEFQDTQKLDQIIQLIMTGDQDKIRAKNMEMIQGSLPDQLKAWLRPWGLPLPVMKNRPKNIMNGSSIFRQDGALTKSLSDTWRTRQRWMMLKIFDLLWKNIKQMKDGLLQHTGHHQQQKKKRKKTNWFSAIHLMNCWICMLISASILNG